MGLKSTPKLCRNGEECLVKILEQNTQGVRRSNSQTQSEQNWFSENKTSWLFHPVSSFCDFFYGRASLPGCKQHVEVLVWIFSAQYGPKFFFAESRAEFHKFR